MSAIIAFPLIFTTQFEIAHDYYVNPVHLDWLKIDLKYSAEHVLRSHHLIIHVRKKTGKKRDGIEQTQHIHIYPPHVIRGITFHFSIHLTTMARNRIQWSKNTDVGMGNCLKMSTSFEILFFLAISGIKV